MSVVVNEKDGGTEYVDSHMNKYFVPDDGHKTRPSLLVGFDDSGKIIFIRESTDEEIDYS